MSNAQILRRQFLANVAQTSPSPMLVGVERAEGVFFYTPEGKRYFDLVSGVLVSNVGDANYRARRSDPPEGFEVYGGNGQDRVEDSIF
jgi:4-aminobutyrate aminotransferase-like enzyme